MPLKTIIFSLLISYGAWAHPGTGIVEDSKGNIFYTDLARVWKIDLNGIKTVVVPNVHTHELYMDANDNLMGEHLWYNGEVKNTWGYFVWLYSAQGTFSKIIPDSEGFRKEYSFVQDHLENMYLTEEVNGCQQVIRRKGNRKSVHSSTCFHNIRNMKVGQNGNLLIVDFQDILQVDKAGKTKTIATKIANKSWTAAHSQEKQNSVFGIWDDSNGNIYAAVYHNREVVKFTPDGKQLVVRKTAIPWAASGGLVSARGDLWLLETSLTNAVRVVQVREGGKLIVY